MIHNFLKLITFELNNYLESISQGDGPFAVAGNIALSTVLGGTGSIMDNKVVISLINLSEEPTLKNNTPYRSNALVWEKEFPPVHLNVFFLFSANFNPPSSVSGSDNNYYLGIERLCQVIEFFQGKPSFSISDSPMQDFVLNETVQVSEISEIQNLTFKMEIVSLSFEQSNHLWGTLGGKQLPFVLYRAHIIPVSRRTLIERGGVITEIESKLNNFSNPKL